MTQERIRIPDRGSDSGGQRSHRFTPKRPERGQTEKATGDFVMPREALERLSKEEMRVWPLLKTAVGKVDDLFALQEGPGEQAKFYPEGIIREEVEKQAGSKPELLSPSTIVEIDSEG